MVQCARQCADGAEHNAWLHAGHNQCISVNSIQRRSILLPGRWTAGARVASRIVPLDSRSPSVIGRVSLSRGPDLGARERGPEIINVRSAEHVGLSGITWPRPRSRSSNGSSSSPRRTPIHAEPGIHRRHRRLRKAGQTSKSGAKPKPHARPTADTRGGATRVP